MLTALYLLVDTVKAVETTSTAAQTTAAPTQYSCNKLTWGTTVLLIYVPFFFLLIPACGSGYLMRMVANIYVAIALGIYVALFVLILLAVLVAIILCPKA